MVTRPQPLLDIADEVLSSGFVVLTGGHDLAGKPLLTFPVCKHEQLEGWSSERLYGVLRHYVAWVECTMNMQSIACLANFQRASKCVISLIVEAAGKLELNARGTISAVYFMKPQIRSRSKLLKKLLGLKPSKKNPKIPLFKVVMMKTLQDIFCHIDLCQVTSEFGGTLSYDHEAWMQFHQTVVPCIREADDVMQRIPNIRDRVELLQEYEITGQSAADIQNILTELTDNQAQFQETLDQCKQTLLLLDSAQTSDGWLSRVHPEQMYHAGMYIRQHYQNLDSEKCHLEKIFREIEENVTWHLQIQRHRERAIEIERKIKTIYEPLMQEHPSVGVTLSQAELYRTHFTTTLYEPSKELLSQATEILQDVQRLTDHQQRQRDVSDILQRLTVALQPFTHELQNLQTIYISVHIFHLIFEKALTWYKKVLKFLFDVLRDRVTTSSAHVVQMPVEWQQAVQCFLTKHPPPREEHIARLDTNIPLQVDKNLRQHARALAMRLRILQRIVFSRRLPSRLLTSVFRWRAEVNNFSLASAPSGQERAVRTKVSDCENVKQTPNSCGKLAPPPKPRRQNAPTRSVSWSSSASSYVPVSSAQYNDLSNKSRPENELSDDVSLSHLDAGLGLGDLDQMMRPMSGLRAELAANVDALPSRLQFPEEGELLGNKLMSDERFIRLTLLPSHQPAANQRAYDFQDSFESSDFRSPENRTGSESGIDVYEAEDPCDTIINKIKAVSSSNLPSDIKLQCMSHLLSSSLLPESSLTYRNPLYKSGGRPLSSSDMESESQSRSANSRSPLFQLEQHHLRASASSLQHNDQEITLTDHVRARFPFQDRHYVQKKFHYVSRGRPASAVARLRNRLARSLIDLDNVSQEAKHWPETRRKGMSQQSSGYTCVESSPHFTSDLLRQDSVTLALRRSYEDLLHSTGQTRGKEQSLKRPSWRSYEGGLETEHSTIHEDCMLQNSNHEKLERKHHSRQEKEQCRIAQKSHARWRENIVIDNAFDKERGSYASREFIAPSFLRPYSTTVVIPFSDKRQSLLVPSDSSSASEFSSGVNRPNDSLQLDSTGSGDRHSFDHSDQFSRQSFQAEQEQYSPKTKGELNLSGTPSLSLVNLQAAQNSETETVTFELGGKPLSLSVTEAARAQVSAEMHTMSKMHMKPEQIFKLKETNEQKKRESVQKDYSDVLGECDSDISNNVSELAMSSITMS